MSLELKIKAGSLALETKLIRRIEKKLKRSRSKVAQWKAKSDPAMTDHTIADGYIAAIDAQRLSIYTHRTKEMKPEARHTHLARMFMKGREYQTVEWFCWRLPDFEAVFGIVKRFTAESTSALIAQQAQQFEQWKQAGMAWYVETDRDAKIEKIVDRRFARKKRETEIGSDLAREQRKKEWNATFKRP